MVINLNSIKGAAKLGFWVALVTVALSWLINFLKLPVVNLTFATIDVNVREQLTSGVDTSVGTKVLEYINGLVPLTLPGIVTIFIASFAIVLVGGIIYNIFHKGSSSDVKRLTLTMLYGTVIIGLILSGTTSLNLGFVGTTIALGIYYAIVTVILLWLSRTSFAKNWVTIPKY